MEMTGEYRIPAPRDAVWEALNDPDVLKQCIPGCDEIEKSSDTEFSAKVTAKVIEHGRGDKIKIVKFKRRKHYRRQMGHRQNYTRVEITGISKA